MTKGSGTHEVTLRAGRDVRGLLVRALEVEGVRGLGVHRAASPGRGAADADLGVGDIRGLLRERGYGCVYN